MSHFTVLVIGDNPEEQLAPFQENNMGNCPKEFMKFTETETEYLKEYENSSTEQIALPNGEFVFPHDDIFKKRDPKTPFSYKYVIPKEYEKLKIPFKQKYKTFENFMKEYHGYDKRDEEMKRYGYWENPNRKWDWYQLGGRWTGFFRLKSGKVGVQGIPGLMTKPAEPRYVDQAKKEDIDVETMRADARMKALDEYLKFEKILNGRPMPPSWEEIKSKYKIPEEIDKARDEYHNHPVMIDINKEFKFFMDDVVEIFGCGRDEYLNRAENNVLSSFAILKDGKWYEKGSMGWWGMVSDEKDKNKWIQEFRNLYNSLPGDTLLSIFDCHI